MNYQHNNIITKLLGIQFKQMQKQTDVNDKRLSGFCYILSKYCSLCV